MKSADGALLDAGTVLFERSDLVGKVNTGCELLAEQVFFDLVVARGLRYMATLDLSSDSDDPDAVIASLGFEIAFSTLGWEYGHTSFQRVVLDGGDVTVCVDLGGHYATRAMIGAATVQRLAEVRNTLHRAFPTRPAPPAPPVTTVPVTFWSLGSGTPRGVVRDLEAPRWGEIVGNYPDPVRQAVGDLVSLTRPESAGKLTLWHGAPGGGKSFALRALLREWRAWARGSYVVDPERFLGDARYMLDVLLQSEPDGLSEGERPWTLLILEDAGEFLAADAARRQGQALSRLLNLTDGLIGQGLKFHVLITTNERVGDLHQAVSRPGRCLANVEFGAFDVAGANAWLAERGSKARKRGPTMLAELYAELGEIRRVVPDPQDAASGMYL